METGLVDSFVGRKPLIGYFSHKQRWKNKTFVNIRSKLDLNVLLLNALKVLKGAEITADIAFVLGKA